ncbi:MAG: peroxiredoxin [Candidatus Dormibacteria bacterium]
MGPGDRVGDFELRDQHGALRRLSEFLAQGPAVIYFYPAAMTRGCTAENCHFRDLGRDFAELGAQVIGISTDSVERQLEFQQKNSLTVPLLSDPGGQVARQFGVRRSFGPIPVKRWTFVVGGDRRVLAVIKSETRMGVHADRALEILRSRMEPPVDA